MRRLLQRKKHTVQGQEQRQERPLLLRTMYIEPPTIGSIHPSSTFTLHRRASLGSYSTVEPSQESLSLPNARRHRTADHRLLTVRTLQQGVRSWTTEAYAETGAGASHAAQRFLASLLSGRRL